MSLSIEPVSGETTLYGKQVNTLQTGVSIDGDVITGNLSYISDYTEFSDQPEEQTGNYLALNVSSDEGATITGEVIGREGVPKTISDGYIVVRVTNKDTESLKLTATKEDNSVTKTYKFTGLTLASE